MPGINMSAEPSRANTSAAANRLAGTIWSSIRPDSVERNALAQRTRRLRGGREGKVDHRGSEAMRTAVCFAAKPQFRYLARWRLGGSRITAKTPTREEAGLR